MQRKFITIALIFYSALSYGIDPPTLVYRCDTRSMEEINQVAGFFPHDEAGIRDYDLMNHFAGQEFEGYTSAFVSVGYDIADVVQFCLLLFEGEPTYIYRIVPGANFYSITTAFAAARDRQAPDSFRRRNFEALIDEYDHMHEYVALNGFGTSRVMNYALITQQIIDDYYTGQEAESPVFEEHFWESRWHPNPLWDSGHIADRASTAVYPVVDEPAAEVVMALNDHNVELPVRFTCQQAAYVPLPQASKIHCHVHPVVKKLVGDQLKMAVMLTEDIVRL